MKKGNSLKFGVLIDCLRFQMQYTRISAFFMSNHQRFFHVLFHNIRCCMCEVSVLFLVLSLVQSTNVRDSSFESISHTFDDKCAAASPNCYHYFTPQKWVFHRKYIDPNEMTWIGSFFFWLLDKSALVFFCTFDTRFLHPVHSIRWPVLMTKFTPVRRRNRVKKNSRELFDLWILTFRFWLEHFNI